MEKLRNIGKNRMKKQKKLKKRREAYHQNKTIKDSTQLQKKCTQGRKRYAYMELAQKTKKCARERQKYANMQPEQKKARMGQIVVNRELKCNTLDANNQLRWKTLHMSKRKLV